MPHSVKEPADTCPAQNIDWKQIIHRKLKLSKKNLILR